MRLSYRQRVGLSMPSLVLRLLLAVVFIWAGLGKVTQRVGVSGDAAAKLANMGIITPGSAASGGGAPAAPAAPAAAPDETDEAPASERGTSSTPEEEPKGSGAGENVVDGSRRVDLAPLAVGSAAIVPAAWQDSSEPAEEDEGLTPDADKPANPTKRRPPWQSAPAVTYTAEDFPDEVRVRKLWEVALLVERAAHPATAEDGSKPMGIWPEALGSGQWPKWQAIAVAATQLGAGVLLVMGLLTRLSALGLMVVTAGAMWLNEIGPAMQAGDTVLGFLPNYATFDAEAWRPLMLSFALFMAALSLFLGGPGRPSVDHALFRRRVIEDHDGL